MNRLYAEGTLCRFSAAAGKDRAHKSTELMNNNNHVFAKAEETSNSARQHAWGQANNVLYVYFHRSLKTTTVGSPVFCTCIIEHTYISALLFSHSAHLILTLGFGKSLVRERTLKKNDTYTARHYYLADVQTIHPLVALVLSKRILHAREKD